MKNKFERKFSSITPDGVIDLVINMANTPHINLEHQVDENSSLKFSRRVVLAIECLRNGELHHYNEYKPKEMPYIFNPFQLKLPPLRGQHRDKDIEIYKTLVKNQTFNKT